MENPRSRISQDIIRSFRKNLNQEVIFMCLFMSETRGGIVTNERPFSGEELIRLFSTVISSTEDYMLPAIMYSLLNLYGPVKVFDMVKDYSRGFEMRGPFKAGPGSADSAPTVSDN